MPKFEQAFSSGDVMRRLHELDRRVQELNAGRRMEDASVGGRGVRITGGSVFEWDDEAGNPRVFFGTFPSGISPITLTGLAYQDATGDTRVTIGEIDSQGQVVHGILVEAPNEQDLLSANERRVMLGRPDGSAAFFASLLGDDFLSLDDSDGNFRATLGTVTSAGNPDGYGILIVQPSGRPVFFASQSELSWYKNGDLTVEFDGVGQDSHVSGGQTDDGFGFWVRLVFTGGDSAAHELRVRDGSNTVYFPIAASDFIQRTSSRATKDVTAEDAGPALDTVRSVPIRRWRHKTTSMSSTGVHAAPPREHVGPMAEDVPEGLADWADPEGGLNLSDGLWTLWRAVQDLADRVDALEAS